MPENAPVDIRARLHELKEEDLETALQAPVVETSKTDALGSLVFGSESSRQETSASQRGDSIFAGLTIGDLVYDICRVSPSVLEATDFARADDLSNVFEYSVFADGLSGLSEASFEGNVAQLQGYVAEQFVAKQLQAQGKEVEIPDEPNQEGYDLLVNGDRFQVKCLSDVGGVKEHLEEYPDIPVFVNEDLASDIDGIEGAFAVPGLEHHEVVEATRSTLDAGADVLDFEVPFIAIAVASGYNIKAMIEGKSDLSAALTNVVLDLGGRTAGGVAGAKAMAVAGTIFGPAGTVMGGLAGSIAGAKQGKRISRWLRSKILCAEEEEALESALHQFLSALSDAAEKNLRALAKKRDDIEEILRDRNANKDILWKDFSWRMTQEQRYRTTKREKAQSSVHNPSSLDYKGGDLLVAAYEASRLMAQTGVHPHSLEKELQEVDKTARSLITKRKRFLLSG